MTGLGVVAFFFVLFYGAATTPLAYVVRVVDGDTVVVLFRGKLVRVRLAEIDALEMSQKGGEEAKRALEKLVLGRWIVLKGTKLGRHKRLIAHLGDANRRLVRMGYAFAYMAGASMKREEAHAKKRRRGVHRHKTVKPWVYRKTARV